MARWSLLLCPLVACAGHPPVATSTPPVPIPAPPITAAPAPTPPALRLPATVRPTHYTLDLTIVPGEPALHGRIAIDLELDQPTSLLWLNGTDLTIERATMAGAPAQIVPLPKDSADFIAIAFAQPVGPGAQTLVIDYQAPIDKVRSRGVYQQAEGDDWYVYTFFEAVDARRAFPCFDEPGAKVPWKLSITTKKELVALANAPVIAEHDAPNGLKTVEFAESKPLPSYLVAFIVGPFDVIDGGTAGHHGTPFRIAAPKGRREETRYALAVTPKIIGLLEDFFGMPYPYGKLDVAVVPRFWGTMEHPGLVALGQPLTLIKPGEETRPRREMYANVASHELAHYWFGDYVTMAWWDDTWLNEALAQWLDAKITDGLEPSWHFQDLRHREIMGAMADDSLVAARSMRGPVETRTAIEDAFDGATTYMKGASVFDMFEHFVGAEKWQGAIRGYLTANAWKNATEADFLAGMAVLGDDVVAGLRSFIEQPGVPLLTIGLDCEKDGPRVTVAQKRFLPVGSKGAPAQLWHVPVCLEYPATSGKLAETCQMVKDTTEIVALDKAKSCPAWVMAKAGGHGYYRVWYEPALRAPLLAAAKQLSVIERLDTLGDLAALVRAGLLPTGDALALLPRLANEPDRNVLGSGLAILGAVRKDLLPAALHPNLQRFVRALYGARAAALGWRSKPGESEDTRQLRLLLLGLVGGLGEDPHLAAEARRLADKYLDDPRSVEPELVPLALDLAARDGDRRLFARLLDAARKTPDREERGRLLAMLGGFRDPALAAEALELAAGNEFDLRETLSIGYVMLGDPDNRELAYRWVLAHFDAIAAKMRDDDLLRVFSVPAYFCDQAHRAEAEAFFGPRAAKVDGAAHTLAGVLESMDLCIAAHELQEPSIEAFLKKY